MEAELPASMTQIVPDSESHADLNVIEETRRFPHLSGLEGDDWGRVLRIFRSLVIPAVGTSPSLGSPRQGVSPEAKSARDPIHGAPAKNGRAQWGTAGKLDDEP
jgi:hypothetical protein